MGVVLGRIVYTLMDLAEMLHIVLTILYVVSLCKHKYIQLLAINRYHTF